MPADWYRPVDVERLADVGESRKFDLPLAELPRLSPALASTDGYAQCRVTFAREQGQPVAEVAVEARLGLRCQRCLKPVWTDVDGRSQVRFVTDPARVDENDLGIEPSDAFTLGLRFGYAQRSTAFDGGLVSGRGEVPSARG